MRIDFSKVLRTIFWHFEARLRLQRSVYWVYFWGFCPFQFVSIVPGLCIVSLPKKLSSQLVAVCCARGRGQVIWFYMKSQSRPYVSFRLKMAAKCRTSFYEFRGQSQLAYSMFKGSAYFSDSVIGQTNAYRWPINMRETRRTWHTVLKHQIPGHRIANGEDLLSNWINFYPGRTTKDIPIHSYTFLNWTEKVFLKI